MPELMKQISFAKLDQGMEMPHLLDIQTRAFESLLQLDAASKDREDIGLERVFKDQWRDSKKKEQTETMLEAHEALCEAAPENIFRFKDVLDYLKQDLHHETPSK